MAVYVDNMRTPYRGMLMCHMFADTKEELVAMARKIGVPVKYMQQPPRAKWLHFDVCQSKRALAVRHGAIETDRYGALYAYAKRRGDKKTMQRIDSLRAFAKDLCSRDNDDMGGEQLELPL